MCVHNNYPINDFLWEIFVPHDLGAGETGTTGFMVRAEFQVSSLQVLIREQLTIHDSLLPVTVAHIMGEMNWGVCRSPSSSPALRGESCGGSSLSSPPYPL